MKIISRYGRKLQDPNETNEVTERSRKFRIKRGILKTHEEDQSSTYEYWRTVVPNDEDLKRTILRELHCVPYSGHPGFARTLEVVRTSFYWKQMSQDVRAFVIDCPVCQTEKSSHLRPAGRLMPLALPTRKWEHVAIDFVTGMPEDNGMNAIMTVVDKATKMCHFIPCSEAITAKGTAQLYWNNVGKLHGIPAVIDIRPRSPFHQQILARAVAFTGHRSSDGVRVPSLSHQVRWNASISYWNKRCDVLYISMAKLGAGRRCYQQWNLQSTIRRTELPDTLPFS